MSISFLVARKYQVALLEKQSCPMLVGDRFCFCSSRWLQ
ncbi:MAG: DUF2237 domain-containing protein [Clostridiales bacterium]|nr:DUF2237 domain-containing protein [Clostridiales bacterium]